MIHIKPLIQEAQITLSRIKTKTKYSQEYQTYTERKLRQRKILRKPAENKTFPREVRIRITVDFLLVTIQQVELSKIFKVGMSK